jgi:MinD superfamily P-loop ATPase
MKELVIISGKGGTGKTSITASFAALAEKATLADCDVDAADLHLILEPEIKEEGEFRAGKEAFIDTLKCTGCGECMKACKFEAVVTRGDLFAVDPISCEGCGVCEVVCPAGAISMREKESGRWFVSDTRHGPMVYAHLKPGEENSGKLVSFVRGKTKETASKNNSSCIIIDGPPGIGCPVIASVGGVNLALIVTEPTQSGVHDLKRISQLTRHFKIRTCVCVNKYDLNLEITGEIEEFCAGQNMEIAGKIPYDLSFTKSMLVRKSVVEYGKGGVSEEIMRMWKKIEQILSAQGG